MEGNPERVNVLMVEQRGVVERGGRVTVEEETKRRAGLDDALSKEALGFAECQQTRGKTDDDKLTGGIEKASLMRGPYFPTKTCNFSGDDKREYTVSPRLAYHPCIYTKMPDDR